MAHPAATPVGVAQHVLALALRAPLLSGGLAVPFNHIGRDPAAFLDVDALRFRPGADGGGVEASTGPATRPPALPSCRRRDLSGMLDIVSQCIVQFLAVHRAEVNLVVRAIQSKPDGALCVAAIDVVDEEGLYLLGHVRS